MKNLDLAKTSRPVETEPTENGAGAPPVKAPDNEKKILSGGALINVRANPSKEARVIDTLRSGEKVTAISSDGDYTKVSLRDGRTGYISSKFLSN